MSTAFIYKQTILRFVFYFVIFFSTLYTGLGQSYSFEPKEASATIEGKAFQGYQTYFEFTAEEVTRAFWQYSKSFAHTENRKSYYKIIVPSENEETDQPIVLFGKPTKNGNTSYFTLAIDLESIDDDKDKYLQQVRLMLIEFKVDLYMNHYQNQINTLSKEAKKLSKAHQKALKKGKLYVGENVAALSRLQTIENQISDYRGRQMTLLEIVGKAESQSN
jgi:hypothetical protein